MSNESKHHIVKYSFYFKILLALLALTWLSVAVTSIELGPLTVAVALLLATFKATLVLLFFMHLKFNRKLYILMVLGVIALYGAVLVITFLDFYLR
jgi:cytochrome c oxidase subunit IV